MEIEKLENYRIKKEELLIKSDKLEELKKNNKISNENDLLGGESASTLFPIILDKLGYLLDSDDRKNFTIEEIKKRKKYNTIIKKIGPALLQSKQIFEDRNELLGLKNGKLNDVVIPDTPVIYVANHGFRDDILGTILASARHAYVVFGSLPHFYNTIDGPLLSKNGVVLVNRKVKESKSASIEKCKMVLNNGCDLILFPEGVWNKTPNKLTLPLWSGVYRIAKETGAQIVPIVHYIKDPSGKTPKKDNPFHTVIDDAINVENKTQEETLNIISDSFNKWTYLMMEKYGQTTRKELLDGYKDSQTAWEELLKIRVKTANRYDTEIETAGDYVPKKIVVAKQVFNTIANLKLTKDNAKSVLDAQKIIEEESKNDFQHKF